jgi:hypothetical protein
MTREWPRVIAAVLVAALPATGFAQEAAVPTAPGLGSWFHPLQLTEVKLQDQVKAIPQEKRDRVHFFLINGLNPGYSANLNGLAAYFRSIGFANTSCHQMPSAGKVRKQIETLRKSDPEARIIVLGYSWGANLARSMANSLQRDGVTLDCIIYLGGDTIGNSPESRPSNVKQVLNINGNGFIATGGNLTFKGTDIDGAVNHRLDVRHLALPAHRDTIHFVGQALINLASPARNTAEVPLTDPPVRRTSDDAPRKLP